MMNPKTKIVAGYLNSLYKEYLELFEKAKVSGDKLWAVVNCELQRGLKKSKKNVERTSYLLL